MTTEHNGANIFVCGSQKFDDKAFVEQTLETFFVVSQGNIGKIMISKFSGACEFAKQWAETKSQQIGKKIDVVDCTLDLQLAKYNSSIFDEITIPLSAAAVHPFYINGKEKMIEKGISLVFAFPNKEGELGASTRNITLFANLANIQVFDCSELLGKISQYREEKEHEITTEEQPIGLKNRHLAKK